MRDVSSFLGSCDSNIPPLSRRHYRLLMFSTKSHMPSTAPWGIVSGCAYLCRATLLLARTRFMTHCQQARTALLGPQLYDSLLGLRYRCRFCTIQCDVQRQKQADCMHHLTLITRGCSVFAPYIMTLQPQLVNRNSQNDVDDMKLLPSDIRDSEFYALFLERGGGREISPILVLFILSSPFLQ